MDSEFQAKMQAFMSEYVKLCARFGCYVAQSEPGGAIVVTVVENGLDGKHWATAIGEIPRHAERQ